MGLTAASAIQNGVDPEVACLYAMRGTEMIGKITRDTIDMMDRLIPDRV